MIFKKVKLNYLFIVIFTISLFAPAITIAKSSSYDIRYKNQVDQVLKQINPQQMWNYLTFLSTFTDRSAAHTSGIEAANWIKSELEQLAKNSGREDISIYKIATKGVDYETGYEYDYDQPSIILKIGNSSEPGIVIGAHFDTIDGDGCDENECMKVFPGVDDDGSGTAVVMETARTLLASGLQFKKPIYLILYAAEENGALGSQSVVNEFIQKKIPIDAVMQLDQVGYQIKKDPTISILNGGVSDKKLAQFMQPLVNTYIKVPIKFLPRNGMSDDYSWFIKGFKTVRPVENNEQSPYTHKSSDTLDKVSLNHMTNFLKLTIAFAIELAEPKS